MIAGLQARTAELYGDPSHAASELNAFLTTAGTWSGKGIPDGLDIGCHAVLFQGLTLTERVDVTDDFALLPFEQFLPFVDNGLVKGLEPPGYGTGGRWGRR